MPRLDEIRARCDAATDGPWKWGGPAHGNDGNLPHLRDLHGNDLCDFGSAGAYIDYGTPPSAEDAAFIAHSREDVPWLLEQLDDAREGEAAITAEYAEFLRGEGLIADEEATNAQSE